MAYPLPLQIRLLCCTPHDIINCNSIQSLRPLWNCKGALVPLNGTGCILTHYTPWLHVHSSDTDAKGKAAMTAVCHPAPTSRCRSGIQLHTKARHILQGVPLSHAQGGCSDVHNTSCILLATSMPAE